MWYKRNDNTPAGRLLAASFSFVMATMFTAAPAAAGDFQVDPVHVTLEPGRVSSKLTIKNVGTDPVSLRVQAFRWTQVDGQDVYTPTDEVLVSPPIFTTPAGETRLVRIGLRSTRQDSEQAYRVMVEEIPVKREKQVGIQVAVRLNLPFYVMPKVTAKPDLQWSAATTSDRNLILTAHNRGTLHQQVTGLAATTSNKGTFKLSDAMGVVLPGSAKSWKIAIPAGLSGQTELQLLVRTSDGEEQARVPLGAH